jgi:hypothetical protein
MTALAELLGDMQNSFCDIVQRSKVRVALYFKRVLARLAYPFPETQDQAG